MGHEFSLFFFVSLEHAYQQLQETVFSIPRYSILWFLSKITCSLSKRSMQELGGLLRLGMFDSRFSDLNTQELKGFVMEIVSDIKTNWITDIHIATPPEPYRDRSFLTKVYFSIDILELLIVSSRRVSFKTCISKYWFCSFACLILVHRYAWVNLQSL
jgi:hypothetical protein